MTEAYEDLFFGPADREIRHLVREFVEKEIVPKRRLIDEDKEHKLVGEILQGLAKLGLFRMGWPEEYGGLRGLSGVTSAIIGEELARGDPGIKTALSCTSWAFRPAIKARNKAVLEYFAPTFCGEEAKLACFAMTEPGGPHGGGGCDVENISSLHGRNIRTVARLDGNEWVINGQKMWASNAGVADAYCITCTTDPDLGEEGIALIYVPASAEGLSFGKFEEKAGMHGVRNCVIYLDDVRVPKEFRAAGPGKDAELLRDQIIAARIGSASTAVGIARAAFEEVLRFTGERMVAGRPIREHSICAGILADMAIGIETARYYYLAVAYMHSHPERYGPQASDFMLSRASIAKVYATEVAIMVTNKAMELMGAYGYSREYPVEKYWRDSKVIQLWLGGAQLARLDVCRAYYEHEL